MVAVCHTLVPYRVEWFHDEVTHEMVAAILGGRDERDLAEPDVRRDLTSPVWPAADVVGGRPVRDRTRAFATKVAIVTADLRAGRVDRVQPWEADAVAGVLGLASTAGRSVIEAAQPGKTQAGMARSVAFTFPWRPSPVRTAGRLGTAMAQAPLDIVDPDAAPVACSLWTPEGRIEARRLGSRWLRPVLAPGSWQPMGVADLRVAASSGRAWRDDPFRPRTGRCGPTFDLSDVAAAREPSKGDGHRIAVAREACLERAGQLLVVEGIVHRPTDTPRAGIGTVFVGGVGRTGPMWAMGDLHSTDSMDTLGHLEPPGAAWCNAQVSPDRDGRFEHGSDLLGLADWRGVAEVLGATSDARWPGDGPWPNGVGNLVDLHEPMSTPDVAACLATAERCARGLSLVMLRDLQGRDPGDHRGTLRQVLSGLRTLGGLGRLDDAALGRFDALCGRVLSHAPSSRIPSDGMWAYVGAIGSHVAASELDLRHVDDDVAGLSL